MWKQDELEAAVKAIRGLQFIHMPTYSWDEIPPFKHYVPNILYNHGNKIPTVALRILIHRICYAIEWLKVASGINLLREQMGLLICLDYGHDEECEGNITPDSGTEVIYCKRCGVQEQITWY